ncbi:MAG: AMP-binding protein [Halobacteriales archaeon]|nr:AMP-binding protein [Halobacteriales archaeon]
MTSAGRPDLSVYDLHERDDEEYEALLDEFEWVVPERFNTATYVCDRWAEEAPERVAIRAAGRDDALAELTYGGLDRRAGRLANHLAEQGVGRGDRVAVNAPQKPEAVIAMVATWKLGGVVVPLSVLFGDDGLAYRLRDADVSAYVVDEAALGAYRAVADGIDLDATVVVGAEPEGDEVGFEAALAGQPASFETAETLAEDDAAILYTSGTTGDPKGVVHAHRYLLANLTGFQFQICNAEHHEDDLIWSPVEWSWGATMYVILLPMLFFGRSMVGRVAEGFDPEAALSLIESHDVTLFFAPATVLRMILGSERRDAFDVSSVRVVSSGGESLDRDVRESIRGVFGDTVIHEAYGQTEALTVIGSAARYYDAKPGMIGRRFPGQEAFTVLDPETLEPVEPGEIGEFAIPYEDNPVCFKSYLNKPERTAEKVQDGWLLMEDLGWEDEDGYFGYHGRKDDVIISSGYRISPAEIEGSLAEHPAVENAAVVGVPDDERGQVPKAFVVTAAGYEPSAALRSELQGFVKDRLAKYEYPRELAFRESLPTTTTGKVRRQELETPE